MLGCEIRNKNYFRGAIVWCLCHFRCTCKTSFEPHKIHDLIKNLSRKEKKEYHIEQSKYVDGIYQITEHSHCYRNKISRAKIHTITTTNIVE